MLRGRLYMINYKVKVKEIIMKVVFLQQPVLLYWLLRLFVFLFINGIPAMKEIGILDFILGKSWKPVDSPPSYGIFPMILGSVYVTAGAVILGVPIGILTAVFMASTVLPSYIVY